MDANGLIGGPCKKEILASVFLVCVLLVAQAALAEGPVLRRRNPGHATAALAMEAAKAAKAPKLLRDVAAGGTVDSNAPKPFDVGRAELLVRRIQAMTPARVKGPAAFNEALGLLQEFQGRLYSYKLGGVSPDDTAALEALETKLENLEGVALKGEHHTAFLGFKPGAVSLTAAEEKSLAPTEEALPGPQAVTTKVNTGWILDQRIYDEKAKGSYPTILNDWQSYDETSSDIQIGGAQNGASWVWEVHAFTWTDTTSVTDHPNASSCLAIMVSGDGGATWFLYGLLYDPSATASHDLLDPKLAVDTTVVPNRLFIAYEYAYSSTDHDVYVYSENNTIGGAPANSQDVGIATTTLMERNPVIASDYITGQASYRVVAYETEYVAGTKDYDIWASQSTGAGAAADWSVAVPVANTADTETNPALFCGASGGTTFTQYVHLAYNDDVYDYSQLLLNPGFELGNDGSWTVNSSGDINCSGNYSRTGSCDAWLGGFVSYTDYIYQDVTIPADAMTAGLVFYLQITSSDSPTTPYDYLHVQIYNTSNNALTTLGTFSNADVANYGSYTVVRYNLAAYKGQTIRLRFYSTNDSTDVTSFFIDDTAVNVTTAATAVSHVVDYARAAHPGSTSYPDGLAAATKLTVLDDWTVWGASAAYGPPTVAASHGGSATITGSRVVVAAGRLAPADEPNTGDPQRYQVFLAWNMCNGGTGCGTITCSPSNLTLDWQKAYFYDSKSDQRFPSLVVDGMGWVQGSTTIPQNGVAYHPYIWMAYYTRDQSSLNTYGEVQMILTDASDESCTGFASGAWYYFTYSATASDGDGLVYPAPRTITAVDYWDGYPGVGFHKMVYHPNAGTNLDPYFTTLGDNYTFDTLADTVSTTGHIDAPIIYAYDGQSYIGPWTFPWVSGYKMTVTAAKDTVYNNRYFSFNSWSSGSTSPGLTVATDFCDASGTNCPVTTYNAFYDMGCLAIPPKVSQGVTAVKSGSDIALSWPAAGVDGDVGGYSVYRATDPSAALNFTAVGATSGTTYTDATATANPVYYYLIVATCGPYSGSWGHFGE